MSVEKIRAYEAEREMEDLTALLQDGRSWVREESIRSLGNLRATQVAPSIEARLRDTEEREYVRAAAAAALGQIHDLRSIPVLSEVARSPSTPPEVKCEAVRALCAFAGEDPEAVRAIEPLGDDADILVAALARKLALTRCGTRAIPHGSGTKEPSEEHARGTAN